MSERATEDGNEKGISSFPLSDNMENEIISPIETLPMENNDVQTLEPINIPEPQPSQDKFWDKSWEVVKGVTGIKEIGDRWEEIDAKDISLKRKRWQKTGAVVVVSAKKASHVVGGTAGLALKIGKTALELPKNLEQIKNKDIKLADKVRIITGIAANVGGLANVRQLSEINTVNQAYDFVKHGETIHNSTGVDKGIAIATAIEKGINFTQIDTGKIHIDAGKILPADINISTKTIIHTAIAGADKIADKINQNKNQESLSQETPLDQTAISNTLQTDNNVQAPPSENNSENTAIPQDYTQNVSNILKSSHDRLAQARARLTAEHIKNTPIEEKSKLDRFQELRFVPVQQEHQTIPTKINQELFQYATSEHLK